MTQDGFAAADRITATLDAACAALLGSRATHYPVDALTAFRRSAHPAAKALFGLRISQIGPGLLSVPRLGTVIEVSSTRRPNAAAGREAVPVLTNRFGASLLGLTDLPSASTLQLAAEPAPLGDEPTVGFTPALAALAEPRATVAPDELSTGSGVEARLVVPPVFHTLTVRGSGNALSAHLSETAEELFSGASPAERNDFAVVAALLAERFATADVAYAGVGALEIGGRRARVSLVVSTVPCSQPIQELAVELSTDRPYAEVWTVLLPAGPAAVLVESRAVPALKELRDAGNGGVSTVAEAFVPMPDGNTVLTVQFSTSDTEDWDLYTTVFADLLCSVQLAWDGVAVAPAPVPVGRAVPAQAAAPTAPPVTAPPVAAPPVVQAPPVAPAVPAAPLPPTPPVAPPPVAPLPAPEPVETAAGTAVRVPPADFNPFATPAPTELPAQATPVLASLDSAPPTPTAPAQEQEQERPKGTFVKVPPPDFNPFGQTAPPATVPAQQAPATDPFGGSDPFATPAPQPAAAAAPAGDGEERKGTFVKVPPPDFNPFGQTTPPPATPAAAAPATTPAADPFGGKDPFATPDPFTTPAPAPAAPQPAAPAEDGEERKGTLVKVPPPDFNPFGQTTPPPAAPAAAAPAPAPAPVAAPRPAAAADPFGTTLSSEPSDPFGTVTGPPAGIPPRPTTPPTVPAPAAPAEPADPTKGTLVKVPPADFNPFAPPTPAAAAAAPAEEGEERKGTLVKVPPPDFNPFGQTAPPPATPAASAQQAPPPPATSPFG
ncbi:hypothetical protein [Kitasatospora sp. NPDC088134]|uniref:hypothetical protein n=1 Tax=Kitasatospora sp. NPDC088134 TaxID=3364071 RepID=UPI0038140DDA